MTMFAFHNDVFVKEKFLARINYHEKFDEIVKGRYWKDGKGCAVGCTIHGEDHGEYEIQLGIPRTIAMLEDRIFENLPNSLAMTWPRRFLEAIPVGKDLSRVWPKFAIFLLTDSTQCNSRHPICDFVASKYRDHLEGENIDWRFVKDKANAAYAANAANAANAADAANAAAYAAANAAAYAAAYAANAADAAAYAAAYAAADATRERAYIAQSEKLLQLLAE